MPRAFFGATLRASTLKISADSAVRVGATEVEGNYTTTHLFVDEVAGDVIPVTVFFDPQAVNSQTCEIFTNLNRRDRAQLDADGDGIDDGIKPPPGNGFVAGDDGNYYKTYTMQNLHDVNPALSGYQLTLNATKTGAYRLTARYRFVGESGTTWHYYNDDGGHRDHCLVVSPKKARDIILYEVNPLTIIAEGTLAGQSRIASWSLRSPTRTTFTLAATRRWSLAPRAGTSTRATGSTRRSVRKAARAGATGTSTR